jgi:uncharacterized protein YjbI with pentapeptide repeats
MLEEWLLFRKEVEDRKHDLAGADLSTAKLMRADLTGANLAEADLSAAYLIRANLSGADLTGADLTDAVLSEANLSGADLAGADLANTHLNGADLSGVRNLTCDQIEWSIIDTETRVPDYLNVVWTSESQFEVSERPPGEN